MYIPFPPPLECAAPISPHGAPSPTGRRSSDIARSSPTGWGLSSGALLAPPRPPHTPREASLAHGVYGTSLAQISSMACFLRIVWSAPAPVSSTSGASGNVL